LTRQGEDAVALAGAIDKARQMGFNPLDLRDRAELFSVARFIDRIRDLLSRSMTELISS
jgi:hypothetical protein